MFISFLIQIIYFRFSHYYQYYLKQKLLKQLIISICFNPFYIKLFFSNDLFSIIHLPTPPKTISIFCTTIHYVVGLFFESVNIINEVEAVFNLLGLNVDIKLLFLYQNIFPIFFLFIVSWRNFIDQISSSISLMRYLDTGREVFVQYV